MQTDCIDGCGWRSELVAALHRMVLARRSSKDAENQLYAAQKGLFIPKCIPESGYPYPGQALIKANFPMSNKFYDQIIKSMKSKRFSLKAIGEFILKAKGPPKSVKWRKHAHWDSDWKKYDPWGLRWKRPNSGTKRRKFVIPRTSFGAS